MKITERRLRSIIRSVIKEEHPLDGQVETDIEKVPHDQWVKWQEGKRGEVSPMYHKVLSDEFQKRGY